METIRLNIGAGRTNLSGFIPVDRKLGMEAYPLPPVIQHGEMTVPILDDSVEEIRASHVLEHFGFEESERALRDWHRVLKPGGRIRIAVPDYDKIVGLNGDPKKFRYLMGGQTDQDDYHKSAWTKDILTQRMTEAGFVDIQEWQAEGFDCAALPISLNLEGVKSANPEDQKLTIRMAAVMALPRVGWNDHWGVVMQALSPFRMPIKRYTTCFWHHGLQTVLEECVEQGLDWVLTLDYDSMFTDQHLDSLMATFARHPEIDALAALQCKRGCEKPLMGILEGGTVNVRKDAPFIVDTAHFGMTLLRVDALRDMPKPWFHGVPGEGGSWAGKGKIDPDIYFWHQWKKNGKTLAVAPHVAIGHLEVMVTEFDLTGQSLEAQHTHVGDWRVRNGLSPEENG